MPTLDVSDAFDASFFDDIVVIRRTQVVGNNGRAVLTEKATSTIAVVTASSPDDLQRVPEVEYMNKAITIYTQYRLQGPAKDEAGNETSPDLILWNDSAYVIVSLDDYSRYGRGFVSAVAVSQDAVDPPPMPAPLGSA
jgi:galactose-6-phosphate isomerase